jgi:hypothetical protein
MYWWAVSLLGGIISGSFPWGQVEGTLNDGALLSLFFSDYRYAVVVSESTYSDPGWAQVVDSLLVLHEGSLFVYLSSLDEIKYSLSRYTPDFIAFVCTISEARPSFIRSLWSFVRSLDDDSYGDAIWGVITGCEPQDVIGKIGYRRLDIRTVLGEQIPLAYFPQGISTSETEYGHYSVKYPDSLDPISFSDGPTDRTEWLVSMLSGDSLIFGDSVDIFYTSGHANYNVWQLHYPTPGQEGYFRSDGFGHLYGDPHDGSDVDIISPNPKIYFGIGNCYIGKIIGTYCMAPAWIRNGGAYLFTGYVIEEGEYSYQMGATQAYFLYQNHYPWPIAFFLGNQVFKFDLDNNTPGIGSPPDLNGAALYGDPAIDARVPDSGYAMRPLLYRSELDIQEGNVIDTFIFTITMNEDGKPGYDGKCGHRSPIVLLPWRIDSITILETNAYQAIVADNFALMYIWKEGDPPLPAGTERYVKFVGKRVETKVKESFRGNNIIKLLSVLPNPANDYVYLTYSIEDDSDISIDLFNILGQKVVSIYRGKRDKGVYKTLLNLIGKNKVSSGLYFVRLASPYGSSIKRILIVK